VSVVAACSVLYVASSETESLTGPEAVAKAIESTLMLDPPPKTTVVHFKVSSHGITLTDLRHRLSFVFNCPLFSRVAVQSVERKRVLVPAYRLTHLSVCLFCG